MLWYCIILRNRNLEWYLSGFWPVIEVIMNTIFITIQKPAIDVIQGQFSQFRILTHFFFRSILILHLHLISLPNTCSTQILYAFLFPHLLYVFIPLWPPWVQYLNSVGRSKLVQRSQICLFIYLFMSNGRSTLHPSQIYELCHIFKGSIKYLYVMNFPCIVVTRHQYLLNFLCVYFLTNLLTSHN